MFVATESTGGSKNDGVLRLGRILSVTGRRVQIEQVLKSGRKTTLERNPGDVSVIVGADELAVNTQAYFNSLVCGVTTSQQKSIIKMGWYRYCRYQKVRSLFHSYSLTLLAGQCNGGIGHHSKSVYFISGV